jgi:DNA-binding transcriptional LysR family regulator
MNIHHLELFFYVAKYKGISAAARHMPYGIQQPAISGQMTQLENSVGTQLFHRRPFGLTPAGTRLFDEIQPFFSRVADLPARLRGQGEERLRLAGPAQILRDYLPEILADYKKKFPGLRLTLHDVNQIGAEDLLRRREVDLAITELESLPAGFIESCSLARLPLVLVVPIRSKLRTFKDVFPNGKPSERLISLPSNEVITKQFQTGLSRLRLTWATAVEVSSIELVDTYAALGFGVGLSVALPRRRRRTGLRELPLRGFQELTISAFWADELSPHAAIFLEQVKTVARQITQQSAKK